MIGEHVEIWGMDGWANNDRARHSAFLMSYSKDALIAWNVIWMPLSWNVNMDLLI